VNGLEEAQEIFNRLHIVLISWINRWVPEPHASAIAARCMANLLRDAIIGLRTPYGPYRVLYESAEFQMRWWTQANSYVVPFGVWRTIPVPALGLLQDVAKLYATIHQLSELAELSFPQRDLLSSVVAKGRYDVEGHWQLPSGDHDVVEAGAILEVLRWHLINHKCAYEQECAEFGALWRHEAVVGEKWLMEFHHHAREQVHGF
jgi:hypothetical protein